MRYSRSNDGRGAGRRGGRTAGGAASGRKRFANGSGERGTGCRRLFLGLCIGVVVWIAGPADAQQGAERGEYLAVRVAMCVQCHTPRDDSGTLILSRRFAGARIPIASPYPGNQWATEAPALAGLAAVRRDDLVSVLTLGKRADGRVPRAPMPQYRMSREDADAIADYLASLTPPVR